MEIASNLIESIMKRNPWIDVTFFAEGLFTFVSIDYLQCLKKRGKIPNKIGKGTNMNITCACMCLVDSAPANAASDERTKAMQGSSPAFNLCK